MVGGPRTNSQNQVALCGHPCAPLPLVLLVLLGAAGAAAAAAVGVAASGEVSAAIVVMMAVAGAISHLRIVQPALETSMLALQRRLAADA